MGADNAQIKMIDEFIAEAERFIAEIKRMKQSEDEIKKELAGTTGYDKDGFACGSNSLTTSMIENWQEEVEAIREEPLNYLSTVFHCFPNDFRDIRYPEELYPCIQRDYTANEYSEYIQTLGIVKRKLEIKKDKLSQYNSRASANLNGADNQFDSTIDLVLQILERSSNLDDAKEALRAVKRNRSENN